MSTIFPSNCMFPTSLAAVSSLKEQNIFILHQLMGTLSPDASGLDLGKRVIELLEADPKTSFIMLCWMR